MMMTARQMGKKGGAARTPAKVKAAAKNLVIARKALKKQRLKLALDTPSA
jgi:hypothetical protein